MDIQKLFDIVGDASRLTRSHYHLTLGSAIKWLSDAPPDAPVLFDTGEVPGRPQSYRGHYSDLSLVPDGDLDTVGKLLAALTKANGDTFIGYKGGNFLMGDDTPLWVANYGCTGRAIIGAHMAESTAVLITKEID